MSKKKQRNAMDRFVKRHAILAEELAILAKDVGGPANIELVPFTLVFEAAVEESGGEPLTIAGSTVVVASWLGFAGHPIPPWLMSSDVRIRRAVKNAAKSGAEVRAAVGHLVDGADVVLRIDGEEPTS